MHKKNIFNFFLITSLMLGAGSAAAHHSFSMFDRSTEQVLDGSVVRWAFNSPHIAMYLETKDGTLYSLEGAGPVQLLTVKPAMNGFTFKPGQHVRVVYCPLHDGRSDGGCQPNANWDKWLAAGYTSKEEAEAAQ